MDKVLQNPEVRQEYYFLIVVQINTASRTFYNGVILNDTTQELVEFSMELPNIEPIEADDTEKKDAWISKDIVLLIVYLFKKILEWCL